jgi:hypothetical protein
MTIELETLKAPDERYRIAYEQAVRHIDNQSRSLDEMRIRGATVMTLAVAITAALGGFALHRPHPWSGAAIAGVASFAVTVLALLFLLWPASGWKFNLSARTLIGGWIDAHDVGEEKMYRELALRLDTNAEANESRMKCRWWALAIGLGGVAVQCVAWLVALR